MPDDQAIRGRIKTLIVERLHLNGLDPAEIDDHATFRWLQLDSVDALELVVCLEKEFAIKVPNQELRRETFESVATLAAVIRRHIAARETA
jgi:acyl carrier protein